MVELPYRLSIFTYFGESISNPFFVKHMMGTTPITAVGMFGQISSFQVPLPSSRHPLNFALGSIVKKPLVIKDRVDIREVLSMDKGFREKSSFSSKPVV